MSKRALSSVTRRFFLKAGSVGGAIGAIAATGVGTFLEACSGGSLAGTGGCSYGYGYGAGLGGYGGSYGYGCEPAATPNPYGGGKGPYGSGTEPYGGGGYGYGYGGTGIGYGGYGGYGYGGYGYGGGCYGYGCGGYGGYGYGGYGYGGYGYGAMVDDPSRSDEQDTALRLGLAPGRIGPAQRIRV